MKALPTNDLASNLKDLDLEADCKPLQNSLVLSWDVNTDDFLFQLSSENKPITQRGILSTVNSIYDLLGFLAPIIIHGKLLLRSIETVKYHTDSKVVLGYINNETRRFYTYVANRVERIRRFSDSSQLNCVPTHHKPADSATRSFEAHEIHNSE
ncbi:uncharacterized protein [Palaemon carinicauda]|uniref:uncharacterized protein n=1 Tax=Palaemon carinicauda TaxID=392227 RepID=UPI0035B5EF8F